MESFNDQREGSLEEEQKANQNCLQKNLRVPGNPVAAGLLAACRGEGLCASRA